ncbi:MAG: ROK family protein [Bacteroidota bacterium]|nr:ROK family protein [Bacteroidota bacterium]
MSALLGAIEAGGTKFVCAVGTGPDDVRAIRRIRTTTPQETLKAAVDFFLERPRLPEAVGIGSFGPVDLHPDSHHYGHITTTPKAGWAYTDFVRYIEQAIDRPVRFDTDVNVAALGEYAWGAGRDCSVLLYLSVGTGIGGGVIVNGTPVHGQTHPEMGHLSLPRAADDDFTGCCPYHGDCLEGLAAGPAIAMRWGRVPESLPEDHPAWALEAHYLGLAITNLILAVSPVRVILGGGIMEQRHLFGRIRAEVHNRLNGYVSPLTDRNVLNGYIVPSALGTRVGVLGAMRLAQSAL